MTSSVYSSSFIYGYLHISLHNNDYPSQPHHALVSGSTNDVAEESFPPRVSSCQTYSKTADINTLMIELSFTVGLCAYTDLVSFRRDPFIIWGQIHSFQRLTALKPLTLSLTVPAPCGMTEDLWLEIKFSTEAEVTSESCSARLQTAVIVPTKPPSRHAPASFAFTRM